MGTRAPSAAWTARHGVRITAIILVVFLLAGLVTATVGGFRLAPFGELSTLLGGTLRYAGIVTAVLYVIVVGVERASA